MMLIHRRNIVVEIKCGCGHEAKYEVYEDKQPHCQFCFEEAISTKEQVPVRRLTYETIAGSHQTSGGSAGIK